MDHFHDLLLLPFELQGLFLFCKSLLGHSVLFFGFWDVAVELAPVLGFGTDEGVKSVGLDSGRRHDAFAFFGFFAGG